MTNTIAAGGIRTNVSRAGRFPDRPAAPRLSVGFILAHRFTLCAFANFVDVLRLAADEGDRSRLQPANSTMEPIYTTPDNIEVQGKLVTVFRSMM